MGGTIGSDNLKGGAQYMSPIYEDEYLPLERNLSRKHRNKQGGQNESSDQNRQRESDNKRGDKEYRPL
jgi:hypothetical protein